MTSLETKPAPDEIEVSVFGPGKGEAIAVHIGHGDWITVDSCVDRRSGRHALLEYFDRIGVDPAREVKLVVGTHAHDDHIAGLGGLYEACANAHFASSAALTSMEFFAEIVADADIEAELKQTVRSEYRRVAQEVKRRGMRAGRSHWLRAIEQRILYKRDPQQGQVGAEVIALSPSDEATARALRLLAEGTASAKSRRRLSAADPNELAIALWVQLDQVAILLGADLTTGPEGCGWKAVMASFTSPVRASLHKVPHHGSPNAHHQPVWDELLTSDVVSVLAPFRLGRTPRPSPDDIVRLASLSSALYASAASAVPAQSRSVRNTAAALQGLARNVREPHGTVGQVRARRLPGDSEWNIALFPPALELRG